MAFRTSLVLIVIANVLSWETVLGDHGYCCPEGHAVIRRKTPPFYCWDPVSNVTSFVNLECDVKPQVLSAAGGVDFYLNDAEQLVIILPKLEVEYENEKFCIGNVTTMNFKDRNLSYIHRSALLCYDEEEVIKVISEEVYAYAMAVSAVLLVITAAIYIALPELRDIQGKSIVNFCLSLGIGLATLSAMKVVSYSDIMGLCAARGFFAYFFIIASFFWSNAISIQMLLSMRRPSVLNYGWREFTYYAIYAWGCPAVLTISMAIVNFVPGNHKKPGIGLMHCWFYHWRQQWYYMYSVMSILIAINICIFIYTSIQIWRQSFASSHIKALKYKFQMTFRLFVVMGIGWMFEMIGSLAGQHIFWEILDTINCLQGVWIFLVLVIFRKRVIKLMHKHGWLDCMSGPVERWLAVGEDEEDVVQHTIGLTMDETKNNNIKQ